jgi:ubiquinone/menaquinone biosynthesis C-methylase UbiE
LAEFTGERVIPGQVDTDLWNEHLARYLFAARLARHKRVLDIACGTGYGAHELAATAASVVGIDLATDAVHYAANHYAKPNLAFLQAAASRLPFTDHSFDLITAFEVIEHLHDWQLLLNEARRLLRPGGQFIVSTPNKLYYAQSRQQAGPNPYHAHEFTFVEFEAALADYFPSVTLFVQNHSEAVLFHPLKPATAAELRLEPTATDVDAAHFYLAVCALTPQMGAPAFAYVPSTANVLRERELHIARLEQELQMKNSWLEQLQADHAVLVANYRNQQAELESRNQWAARLDAELQQTAERVAALQQELADEQAAGHALADGYEAKVAELTEEVRIRTEWALGTEQRLTAELQAKCDELARCVELLERAEATVEERSKWALQLSEERDHLLAQLHLIRASRWYRMGRKFGLGPEVRSL